MIGRPLLKDRRVKKNKKYGFWKALLFIPDGRKTRWLCRCICGTEKEIRESTLARGYSKSCGCKQKELLRIGATTHGMSYSNEYNIWRKMMDRCHSQNHPAYKYYGGAGVIVCKDWRESFLKFYADMGPRPSKRHSLDRWPNNNGNYEPGNVRWATDLQQQRNRRNGMKVTFKGKTLLLKEWAEVLGVSYPCLWRRLKMGYSVQEAFTLGRRVKSAVGRAGRQRYDASRRAK